MNSRSSLVMLSIFAGVAGASAAPVAQDWLTPPYAFDTSAKSVSVVAFVVPKDHREEAIRLLLKDQIVELSEDQAELLSSLTTKPSGSPTAKPFLVRAVNANEFGKCSAEQYPSGNLYVFCGSLGEWRYQMWPLIVYLEQKPAKVGVGAMTAK